MYHLPLHSITDEQTKLEYGFSKNAIFKSSHISYLPSSSTTYPPTLPIMTGKSGTGLLLPPKR